MNFQIKKNCLNEITDLTHMETEGFVGSGESSIIECLKKSFRELKNADCKKVCTEIRSDDVFGGHETKIIS